MMTTGSLRTVILTESYFGKPKLCLEMEKCIHDIRAKFPMVSTKTSEKIKDIHAYIGLRDAIKSKGFDSSVMNSPEWKKFKKLLEKQFGFWSVSFVLLSIQEPNAAAVQIAGNVENVVTNRPYKSLKVDQQGFHYKPEDEFCILIMITEGLLFDSKYSDAEVLAVMLHEIGHCFDSATFKYMGPLSFLTAINNIREKLGTSISISALVAAINLNKIRNDQQVEQVNNAIDDKQGKLISLAFSTAMYYFERIAALAKYKENKERAILAILGFAGPLVGKSATYLYRMIKPVFNFLRKIASFNPVTMIKDNIKSMFFGKAQEHFADKFAAMHGYGPELITGLGKLETGKFSGSLLNDAIDKVPIVRDVYGLTVAGVFGIYTSLMSTDAHPNFAARFNSVKNIVKADLNDPNIDPKTKKLLTKQIEQIDDSFKKFADNAKELGGATGKWHARLYQAYNKILPGRGDISSFIMDKTGLMSDKKISARVNSFRDNKFRLKK